MWRLLSEKLEADVFVRSCRKKLHFHVLKSFYSNQTSQAELYEGEMKSCTLSTAV